MLTAFSALAGCADYFAGNEAGLISNPVLATVLIRNIGQKSSLVKALSIRTDAQQIIVGAVVGQLIEKCRPLFGGRYCPYLRIGWIINTGE